MIDHKLKGPMSYSEVKRALLNNKSKLNSNNIILVSFSCIQSKTILEDLDQLSISLRQHLLLLVQQARLLCNMAPNTFPALLFDTDGLLLLAG